LNISFIFIKITLKKIWLVIHNQKKVIKTIKRQTVQFNKQFNGFNQFGKGCSIPTRPAKKIANNQELNKNINKGIGNF